MPSRKVINNSDLLVYYAMCNIYSFYVDFMLMLFRGFFNAFNRRATGFHRQAKLFKLNLFITCQTRQAKSSPQLVNLLQCETPSKFLFLSFSIRTRLKAKNLLYIQQLLYVLTCFLNCLGGKFVYLDLFIE